MLPELLPEYEKVIYVDCDVVIRNNLARLYREVDLKDNYLAGVFEAPLDFQLSHIQALGCAPGSYVNSGFLVMNLALLRQDGMTRKFLAESKKEDYLFPDQDILNKLCKGRILGLPPIYNSLRTFFLPQYKADFLKYYSAEDWEAVQRHGNVHYTGAKPWDTFTIKFSIWWRYYESLPAELKEKGRVNRKMQYMHKIFSTQWGSLALEGVQNVYRRLKYRTA